MADQEMHKTVSSCLRFFFPLESIVFGNWFALYALIAGFHCQGALGYFSLCLFPRGIDREESLHFMKTVRKIENIHRSVSPQAQCASIASIAWF